MSQILFVILVLVLCFSPDNSEIVVISTENAAQLDLIQQLHIVDSYANALAFNPANPTQLALAQANGLVSIWDSLRAIRLHEWTVLGEVEEIDRYFPTGVTGIAYTTDGRYLITTAIDGMVAVWNANDFTLERQLSVDDAIPSTLAVANDYLIAVGYLNGNVRLWNVATGEHLLTLFGYMGRVVSVAIRSDGSHVAFGYSFSSLSSPSVFVYRNIDLERQQANIAELLIVSELSDLAFYPDAQPNDYSDGGGLVTAGNFTPIQFWDVWYASVFGTAPTPVLLAYPEALGFNSEGSLLAIVGKATTAGGSCDSTVEANHCPLVLLDTRYYVDTRSFDFTIHATRNEHNGGVKDVAFSPDDRLIASADSLGTVFVWGVNG